MVPVEFEQKEPAVQLVQISCPISLNEPTAQTVLLPPLHELPASHLVHEEAPDTRLYDPPSHTVGLTDSSLQ